MKDLIDDWRFNHEAMAYLALRPARQRIGTSLRGMAAMLGVSPTFLSMVETGKSKIPAERLRDFQDHYGVVLTLPPDERAWLIESQDERRTPIWLGARHGLLAFEYDSLDAVRFARQCDAEAARVALGFQGAWVTEHRWVPMGAVSGGRGKQ